MYGKLSELYTYGYNVFSWFFIFLGQDGSLTNGLNAMLDYALNEYIFGEKACTLHADNCSSY